MLREARLARPLAELVTEVEQNALGLDIEVASRPGADPAAARADLDAFADAAAAFAGDTQEPTLGAFLAYLAMPPNLRSSASKCLARVGETDSVESAATVHAAKGLQWAAVFVPGLVKARRLATACLPGQAAGDDAVDRERPAAALRAARRRRRPIRGLAAWPGSRHRS